MAHSSRRRDNPYAQDHFYGSNPAYWDDGGAPAGPPRRSKSERHTVRPSFEDQGASRGYRGDAPRSSSHRQGDNRPPPAYRYEDPRGRDPRRDSRDYRDTRDSRDYRNTRDVRDPRASHHDRDYPSRGDRHSEGPHRHQRSKTAEDPRYSRPSTDHRSRDYPTRNDRDRHGGAAGYTKTRDFPDDGGRDRHGGHSSRSHGKDKPSSRPVPTAAEPPRGRDKHTSSGGGGTRPGFGAQVRSATAPAAQKATKFWQNKKVQQGARAAFSAGATAAMNSRGKGGEWVGAKGFQVASAAIGAVLMDSVLGGGAKKDEGGDGGGRDRDRGRSSSRDRDRDRGRDRSKSKGGGGGDITRQLLQTGFNFLSKR